MNHSTQQRLLALNRRFYTEVAAPFHSTRVPWSPGLQQLLNHIPAARQDEPISVLDAGCGNGRFAHILDSKKNPFVYWGIDNGSSLLTLAGEHTHALNHGAAHFAQVDLSAAAWADPLTETVSQVEPTTRVPFDFVLCTATLQHLPGYEMRLQAVREMASLARKTVVLSAWQFMESERLRSRLIDWEDVNLSADDVEEGDALLPWKQGVYSIRYVHQIDPAEMARLTRDAGLTIVETFRADGKENLNYYAVCRKNES